MKKQIEAQIDSASRDLQNLDREAQKLAIQRAAIQSRITTLKEMLVIAPEDDEVKRPKRQRALKSQWQQVLYLMITRTPNGANYDQIHKFAQMVGLDVQKSNLRTNMMNYKNQGLVDSPKPGIFAVTSAGKTQAKQIKIEEPGAQAPGSNNQGSSWSAPRLPIREREGSIPSESTYTSSSDDDDIPF